MTPRSRSTPVARASGTLLYRQIFTVLRDEISRSVYSATGALPKEEDLCGRFGVSRITVRRALAELVSAGLVERRHGLGTFVRSTSRGSRSPPNLGFLDRLRVSATETNVRVLSVEKTIPYPDIAGLLHLPAGALALRAVRLRTIGGMPVMMTEAWIPLALAPRVTGAALRDRALYQILMDRGVTFGRVVQEITAQAAAPDVARRLRTETGSPLIKLVRLMHDDRSRPVLHLTALLPPERSRILMDIPGEKVNTFDAGKIDYHHAAGPSTRHD